MKILSITVVNTGGADNIYFTTDLSKPLWPFEDTGATFKIESAKAMTDKWLENNFPDIPVKKIKG